MHFVPANQPWTVTWQEGFSAVGTARCCGGTQERVGGEAERWTAHFAVSCRALGWWQRGGGMEDIGQVVDAIAWGGRRADAGERR